MINIKTAITHINQAKNSAELQEVFDSYLGKKGQLSEAFKKLATATPDEKKELGQTLSTAKQEITDAYTAKQKKLQIAEINSSLENDIVDGTLPAPKRESGHYSLLTKTRREVEEICHTMGFIVEHGHDIVTKFENFESLNIPLSHPATEMHDTLYLDQKDMNGEQLALRTHTTAMQNMLIGKYGVPLKIVIPGKVYRNENTDATHDTTFYQLDGLVIDKDITVGHMIQTMKTIIAALVNKDVEIRTRPAYFPFVEPGIEMDARYPIVDDKGNKTRSKWMEIVGAGLVHPNVLITANLDPKEYNGFAFGFGINRLVAVRHGLKDIRYFTNGDLRFAKSF